MQWLAKCKCVHHPNSWYPTRLIDLAELKSNNFLDTKRLISTGKLSKEMEDKTKVRLVETTMWERERPDHENTRYVTLSHRWGSPGPVLDAQLKLTSANIHRFKDGLALEELPATFRDAIKLASRLPKVGYIWIDSLCIKQGAGETVDWLHESALMDRVYRESFLNISATASESSAAGLYRPREPQHLLGDEIVVNIDGIPGTSRPASSTGTSSSSTPPQDIVPTNLPRCTILDASFWTVHVDEAPLNKRGWVLQERLLAPRVLHFCYDQIAWECSEFDAAEGLPRDIPNFQLNSAGVVEEGRLKGLKPDSDGRALRTVRLQGYNDPDAHLGSEIYAFELWKRIVEVYSKMALTNSGDKLIALSGIAKLMATKIGSESEPAEYVAGLWGKHLASQLLWRVEPVFREVDHCFEHFSCRPDDTYRAPSFSWASIDADRGNGIVYGEVTDRDLHIEVVDVGISLKVPENKFGIINGAHVTVRGKLRKIYLYKKDKGRFSWRLEERGGLEREEHSNVYLDCPKQQVFESDDMYCLPAAEGERTAPAGSKYLICLLLELQHDYEYPTFKRIGLTKLSPWTDKLTMQGILNVLESDIALPHQGYDEETGQHTIKIV